MLPPVISISACRAPRPPQPLPPLPEATAAFLQPPYVMSTINEYRVSAGKKRGTRFDFWSSFVALFDSRPCPPLRAVTEGFAASHPTGRGQDTPCHPAETGPSAGTGTCQPPGCHFFSGFLYATGKGVLLPNITQPVAHSPLVVLADLSRWPATGLERIKTNPFPTATRCSWQVRGRATGSSFHTPSPAPSSSGAKKLWFCWSLGWAGCCS